MVPLLLSAFSAIYTVIPYIHVVQGVSSGLVKLGLYLYVAPYYYDKQPNSSLSKYRVTIQVVSNLPLSQKQKFHFSTWASYYNRTFILMSTAGLTHPEWSPCTSTHLICARLGEDEVDPLSGYDAGLCAGVPHVAALALAPDPLDAGLGDRVGKNESTQT